MQLANKRLLYAQRLHKDIAELFSHDFSCSSSNVSVIQQKDEENINQRGYLILKIKIFEGPYRGGCYSFSLDIPECYPFRMVDIYASQPIWHPNIDLFSGKVTLPLDWSPVLTLNSLALGVQMIMLEPSAENPSNIDALSYYISNGEEFDKCIQRSIQGNFNISGVRFASVLLLHLTEEETPRNHNKSNTKSNPINSQDVTLHYDMMNQTYQNTITIATTTTTSTTTTTKYSRKRSLSTDKEDRGDLNNSYNNCDDYKLTTYHMHSSSMDIQQPMHLQLLYDNDLLMDQLSLQSTTNVDHHHHNENELSTSNIIISHTNNSISRDKNKLYLVNGCQHDNISMNNSPVICCNDVLSTISPKRLKMQHSDTILSNI